MFSPPPAAKLPAAPPGRSRTTGQGSREKLGRDSDGLGRGRTYFPAIPLSVLAMAIPRQPVPDPRGHLERCWVEECDIDPMILRLRLLRHQGCLPQAACLEQELLPLV